MSMKDRIVRIAKAYARRWSTQTPGDLWPDLDLSDIEELLRSWKPRRQSTDEEKRIQLCYRRLELHPGASLAEVKQAWKRLMKEYHPDRFHDNPEQAKNATLLCQHLTEAYLELKCRLELAAPER